MLIKDQWLSKVTGINCFNVKKKNFLFKHNKKRPALITYKKESKNKNRISPIFVKIGENIIFKKKIKKNSNYKDENLFLVPSIKSEKKKLIEICLKNMKSSRFDLDKRISNKLIKKIRYNWISSYFSNIKKKIIYSVKIKNKLIGLLCIKKDKANIIIDLITLNKKFIGKGIGKKMIKFLEVNFANHKNILVGTYKENKKAILFYRNNGFKRFKSYEVYHCYEK